MSRSELQVEDAAIVCSNINFGNLNAVEITKKSDLLKISYLIREPILRKGNDYYILDRSVYYHYQEKK